jgi:hypothetical protein
MIFYQNKQILGNFLTIFYVLDLASPCCGVASKGRKPQVVHKTGVANLILLWTADSLFMSQASTVVMASGEMI